MPNNTLEKWEEKQLKDICDFHNGLWTGKKEPFIECNVIRNANFTKDFKLNYDNVVKINVEERQFQTRELEYGDLILEKSGGGPNQPVGRVVIFDKHEKGYSFSNFTSSIRIKNKDILDFRFLYLYLCHCYLSGMTTKMQKNSTGIRNLLFDDYKNISVPIPNISEQQRIVGILDEAFENIGKAKQNTLQNLNNAKELFESYLKKYFEIGNSTWNKYKLSEITTKIGSGATPLGGKKAYIDSGISLIRSMNVYDREFIYEGLAHINEEQAKQLNVVTIQEKDVLLNITGASVARCCVVPSDIIPARVNQHVSIIRPKQDIVSSRFLCYLLTSNYYKNKLLKDGEDGGATRQALTKMGLEQFEVYIPNTLEEQQKIVEQLEELQEQTKKLEQIYTQKLQDLDELKQSILQKAFNGEL